MEKSKENIVEKDLQQIKDILQQVPQKEIPDYFQLRLKEALREEGKNIRLKARKQRNKMIVRVCTGVAACFAIGIITLSVYNDSMPAEEAVVASAERGASIAESPGAVKGEAQEIAPEKGIAALGEDNFEVAADEEKKGLTDYTSAIEEYLDGLNYEVMAAEWVEETDRYYFDVRVTEGEGRQKERFMRLVGEKGEIYEEPVPDKE